MRHSSKIDVRSLVMIALMTAFISVSSIIAIPLVIPITLQTFGVYFALFFLGGKRGSISVFLYVLIGCLGLPVFSGFGGGVSRLFDAGGGYIIGFVVASLTYWLLVSVLKCKGSRMIAIAVSLSTLYISGVLWYAFVYLGGGDGVVYAISVGVLPFIIPDVIKIYLADFIARRLNKIKYKV